MSEIRQRKPTDEPSKDASGAAVEASSNARTAGSMKDEAIRTEKMFEAMSEKAPSKLVPYLKKLAPVVTAVIIGVEVSLPVLAQIYEKVQWFLAICPADLLYAMLGLVLCFFGGMYPTTIAAYEAWSQLGGQKAIEYVNELFEELEKVHQLSLADDTRDDDGDGVNDVNQLSGAELLKRKTALVLAAVDPTKLNNALAGLYSGWVGVLGVLNIQFAKTIALGCSIGNFVKKPMDNLLAPPLEMLVDDKYKKWIPAVIGWIAKYIGVQVAWYIQKIISAFHSAIRGGLMFSRGILKFAHNKGYFHFKEEESSLDEIIGWSLAAVGFYFQFMMGFKLPFPFNILLFPIGMVEAYIQWTLTN